MHTCIELRYRALTNNYPAVTICPSIVLFSCSVYAPDLNMKTKNPLVDVSVVFMDPYLPDSTNEDILLLIPSRQTWCISSNVSDEVDFCDNSIMFQLLKDPNNDQ